MKNSSIFKNYLSDKSIIYSDNKIIYFFVNNLLPSLIIILANTIITQLILRLTAIEKLVRYSDYQISILNRAFFYFLFNMLIVPGLAIPAGSNLYLLWQKFEGISENIFNNFYLIKDGDFFITLILQNSAITFLNNINNFGKLYNGLFSPTYSVEYIKFHKEFIKYDTWIFTYGFNYAQTLTLLSIAIVYCVHIPLCILATIIYLFSRIISDIHNLLIFYKKEIESSGKLVHNAMNNIILIIIVSQICILLNIYNRGNAFSIIYMLSLITLTTIFYLIFLRPFIKSEYFPDESEYLSRKELDLWINKFTHPYIRLKENYDKKLKINNNSNNRRNRNSIRLNLI